MFKRSRLWRATIVAGVLVLTVVGIVLAATFILNYTGAKPTWLNPGWRFWIDSDTALGEAVCIEVHPQGDAGNYIRTQCAYDATGNPPSDWRCDVFTGGVPAAFQNATVEYQFFIAKYDDVNPCLDDNGGWLAYCFTGFGSGGTGCGNTSGNLSFVTGPNAITLSSLTAVSTLPAAFPWLAGAALALGGVLAWRRKRG